MLSFQPRKVDVTANMASLSLGCGVIFVWSTCLPMLNSLENGLITLGESPNTK